MSPVTERFLPEEQPEVFFSTSETAPAVHYHTRKKRLRKLGPRLYTNNLVDAEEVIVRRNLWRIVAGYFPGAVIADRTAIELQPASDGSIFLVASTERSVQLPGIRLRPRHGAGPAEGDQPWMGEELHMSSRPRGFLENMRQSRSRGGAVARTLSKQELEEALDAYARLDPEELNRLRDDARELAPKLGAEKELEALDELIGSLYGTREGRLQSKLGRARQRGLPYDPRRLELFEALQRHLLRQAPPRLPGDTNAELQVFAFFEAYFSNFIEGTEFDLEEAERIVFEGEIPAQRPKDAHDILGTYRLVSDDRQRQRIPHSDDELIELLRSQHRIMLREREEAAPGEFKQVPNRVGATQFVEPALVEGTLREGYRFYGSLPEGFPRAIFAHFLVAEVHPFADGNGRMARVLINSELTAAGEQRIIIPTIERYEYLTALRAMTHNQVANTLVRKMERLQRLTAEIDFSTLDQAEQQLNARDAFADPSEVEQGGLVTAIQGLTQAENPEATE